MSEPDVQLHLISEAGPLRVARETFCALELEGEPRAWSRPGARIQRGDDGQSYILFYVSTEERLYREQLAWCAKAAMRGRAPTGRPVAVLMHAFMPVPRSWREREQADARSGARLPVGKPDADNFLKLIDAFKGLIWLDDTQVVDGRVIKRYSATPALRVEVREFYSAASPGVSST